MTVEQFAARHIGPDPDDAAPHAGGRRLRLGRRADGRRDPRGDPLARHAGPAGPATEEEALAELRALAGRNTVAVSMIGLGYYGTHTPAVIRRNVLENPAWYTAYTPYQPEISQGRLEALLNFQTMVTDLTGLATGERVDARRGHRRGRGDDAGPAGVARPTAPCTSSTPTPCRRPSR